MGFLDRFRGPQDPTPEIEKIVPIADCSIDCNGEACGDELAKFPRSVKIDTDMPLWQSSQAADAHFLISTGKTDWIHNIADVNLSIAETLNKNENKVESIVGGSFKASNTSAPVPGNGWVDKEKPEVTDVLVLPQFLSIKSVSADHFVSDLETLFSPSFASSEKPVALPSGALVERSHARAYILLCSHKTRDRRCGVTAPLMKKQFEKELREHDLFRDASDDRPGGVSLMFVNHVGGHKVAANVIVYLSTGEMIWLARCTPAHCKAIVKQTVMQGKAFPNYTRIAKKCAGVAW